MKYKKIVLPYIIKIPLNTFLSHSPSVCPPALSGHLSMSCLTFCSLSGIVSDLALADLSSTSAFIITSNSAERGVTCHNYF
jgi:hypothetical protein